MARRQFVGQVIKKSSDKTVTVLVQRKQRHPLYHKEFIRKKKYLAHDEHNAFDVGLEVVIEESRPISKRKTWVVLSKVGGIS